MPEPVYNVLVLDMQPIDPPVGGGRLRLLGLYHALGKTLPTTYVGTYDWPGEKKRDHKLSETLREINIPLSDDHFAACGKWQALVSGKTIIDVSFHQLGHLSPSYVDCAKDEVLKADIVIFSHPWVYPLVKDCLRQRPQIIVYDSHNVEGYLRATLLDDRGFGTDLVKEVIRIECELCHDADLVLACSHEDREMYNRLYDVEFGKMRIIPNGVFTGQILPVDNDTKKKKKNELGLPDAICAIFIGSPYGPNVDAANFICGELAPNLPKIIFIIAGGVGNVVDKNLINNRDVPNIHITGFLTDDSKLKYLAASDIAINPMFGGSGTNIKMFDFMAAGIPIVSTPIGARGIEGGSEAIFKVCEKEDFPVGIKEVANNQVFKASLVASARVVAEQKYSWERITGNLGSLVKRWRNSLEKPTPFFTVVIPSYERHELLSKVVSLLSQQTLQDFEIIVVDQSQQEWPDKDKWDGIDLLYIHSDIKGAIKARNLAAFYARGKVIAFTDDDCEPAQTWLANAKPYFDQGKVVGVEGLIKSDKRGDPNYRTVTNEGFEGIGFMTANLFLRGEVFNAINGFDERFDNPHFREDTDLGWRALQYGEIPFAHDVNVFHPPHLSKIERESPENRNRFFEKDALLLQKHPKKYKELFLREMHSLHTPGFWENFERGALKYGVAIPEFYKNMAERK